MTNLRVTEIKAGEAVSKHYGEVDQDISLDETFNLMLCNEWTEVIVTGHTKRLGLVSRKRLLNLLSQKMSGSKKIKDICVYDPISVNANMQLLSARELMRNEKVGRMPVINDDGTVAGILTANNICNTLSFKLESVGNYLYAIIDNIPEAIQGIDQHGNVTIWNKTAEKIFNITSKEVLNKQIADFFPDDLLLDVINNSKTYINFLVEYSPGFFLLRNTTPIYADDGRLSGAICTSLDVSRYMRMSDMLETAASRAKTLERATGDATDKECLFFTVNAETRHMLQQARKAAATDATILIEGESGTGKEVLAYEIYRHSKRFGRPFIEVNCSAIPEGLFESEMFGYEAGTFTGNDRKGKKGKFELADGGTLFLDEIGDIPLYLQSKLLRAIQERRYHRLGGSTPVHVNLRIICATNRNMEELVKAKMFREDLYYRLNVVRLYIPPLRKRPEDIPGLARLFVGELSKALKRPAPEITPELLKSLSGCSWPGNVRQLRNAIETMIVLCEGNDAMTCASLVEANLNDTLLNSAQDPAEAASPPPRVEPDATLEGFVSRQEKQKILQALADNANNKVQAAKSLGIPRSTLYYKMKNLGIA
ncbi:MAG: sigma 54-interacting transcriptional regulator [Desulfovibrio sp.]|jgi:transcriptional regulator with PAS, ATPase and Fis domain|nr:sigma 54-interacting transcriptional regulator [Desulfovibrio sp.]